MKKTFIAKFAASTGTAIINNIEAKQPPTGGKEITMSDEKNTMNAPTLPILYGVLNAITKTWFPSRGTPEMEERAAYLTIWCPECRCNHRHGWNLSDDPAVPQHRAAHCHDRASAYNAAGYMIAPFPPSAPEFAQHAVEPGKPIRRPIRSRRSTRAAAAGRPAEASV